MDISPTFLLLFAILQSTNSVCRRAEYLSVSGECCPMCGKGLVVRKDCTEDSSTSCIPCLKGTYMDEPNGYDKCRKCTVCDAGQGLYTLHECTTTDDVICDVLNGYYCVGSSSSIQCNFAVKHTKCTAGQKVKTPGSKISDTECENCSKGQFSTNGTDCIDWTDCDAIGKRQTEAGSAIRDVTCTDVPRRRIGLILSLVIFLFLCCLCLFYGTEQHAKCLSYFNGKKLQHPTTESAKPSDSGCDGAINIPVECVDPHSLPDQEASRKFPLSPPRETSQSQAWMKEEGGILGIQQAIETPKILHP